jgi:hypothetical protein
MIATEARSHFPYGPITPPTEPGRPSASMRSVTVHAGRQVVRRLVSLDRSVAITTTELMTEIH